MTASKLKINFFGEAISLIKINATAEQLIQWESIAKRMKSDFPMALVDPYFYHLLKDKNIQSSNDLKGETTQFLLNTPKNQIEIWYKNKKIQKLVINDFIDEMLLFPLYKTIKSQDNSIKENGIYIEQKLIGLIGSFEIYINDLNINDLYFHLSKIDSQICLEKVSYQNQNFKLNKTDSLINYQNCYLV